MHERWDLSLDKNRELIEHGYAVYIVLYADLMEKMRQDFMEQEEYDAQFKLDPKIDNEVKTRYLQYLADHLRVDTERIDAGYNNYFKSLHEQYIISKRSHKSAKHTLYVKANVDMARSRITSLIQIHQERV